MNTLISSVFDSGNIIVDSAERVDDIRLRIRDDSGGSGFKQWFHFRLYAQPGQTHILHITNAGECTFADGWFGYHCVASYDRKHWFRIPTTHYEGGTLTVELTPQRDTVWLAYFEPYSYERHQDLIAGCAGASLAQVRSLGYSVQGRNIDLVQVGETSACKPNIWIVARQHPGETMAQWFVEGMLERLLDRQDPVARAIREQASLCIVPNINPDGSVLGNLRSNAAGVNLNRQWQEPSPELSPEVWHVETAMREGRVDLFLDIHGDETLPSVFFDGSQMVPGYGARNIELQTAFMQDLLAASPDFQLEQGYKEDRFNNELLTLASKWVAHTFRCVSLTLEMPFKDSSHTSDEETGWNGERSRKLGAAMLYPILGHLQRMVER